MVKKLLHIIMIFTILLSTIGYTPVLADDRKTPSMLRVEGNRILNEENEVVRLVGAAVPSMEWGEGEDNIEQSYLMLVDNWNANAVRMSLSQGRWFGWSAHITDGGLRFRKRMIDIVNMITSRGKYVIIDLHWSTAGREYVEGNQYRHADMYSLKFWEDMCDLYANNPGVIFDMYNEPHDISWDVWKNGGLVEETPNMFGDNAYYVPGYQKILDTIRGRGAKNIVIAGGLDWAYELRGLAKGYDGLPNGYRLEEPEGDLKGNGIIYSSHIYPFKGDEESWDIALSSVKDEYPILIGEFGHFNNRIGDSWYNGVYDVPHIWQNQLYNYIIRNGFSYMAWSFHNDASPIMLRNWDYQPTPYNGLYQKFQMSQEIDTRPQVPEVVDQYPLYTWKHIIDFDEVKPNFGVYKLDQAGFFATEESEGISGSGQLFAFDTPMASAAGIADFPEDWDLSGASMIWFRIKGDSDQRNIGVGLELEDGRQFKVVFPMNLYEGWQTLFCPIECLKGEAGLLDTDKIKSVFFTNESDGPGSFTIDDFTIAGSEYIKSTPMRIEERFESDTIVWNSWADTENSDSDSFTTKRLVNGGLNGTGGRQFSFKRPIGSLGGEARGQFPKAWNLTGATTMSFWIKGSGDLDIIVRLSTIKDYPQKTNLNKRELEKFCIPFHVKGTDWQKITFRMSDFFMSETFELERINAISLFNARENAEGNFIIDNLVFSNEEIPLKEKYETHPTPQPSEKIAVLPYKYSKNIITQAPKDSYVFKAGEKGILPIEIHNKTKNKFSGLLKIEGEPEGLDLGAQGGFARYVALPEQKTKCSFQFTPSKDMIGTYKILVIDTLQNGVPPQEYTIRVER